MLRLILLGAPGAGKGTQADIISCEYGIPQISTGVILREEMAKGTELGNKVKILVENGQLVPDSDVISIVKNRLSADDCRNGYILDGFPRTIPQAEALDSMLAEAGGKIDAVISIEVDDADIIKRMSGRRVCKKCGASFHIEYNPSKNGDNCDKCNSPLVIRADDDSLVVTDRLTVYHKKTAPLKDYYAKQGKLKLVKGCELLSDTTANVKKALGETL